MDSPPAQSQSLDDIRRAIDRIDDRLLKLVGERLALIDQVRAAKRSKEGTPMRPAREAAVLKRLIESAGSLVPAELCFQLWRALISAATQRQSEMRIHGSTGLFTSANAQVLIRQFFSASPLVGHPGETGALQALVGNASDIAAVAIDAPWVEPYLGGLAGKTRIIGCLPFIAQETMPRILIFGHAAPEPTGDDQTLVITDGQLPRDFVPAPVWQMRVGTKRLTCLPGFLSEHSMPLLGLVRSNSKLALTVVGHYPSPIERKP